MPFKNLRCYDVTDPAFGGVSEPGGFVGDGTSNCSDAIQAAINAILADYGINGYFDPDTSVYLLSMPVLYFPPGRYRIKTAISFPVTIGSLTIQGDNAIILPHQDFPNGNFSSAGWAFSIAQGYKYKIEGLSFMNFKKALSVNTNVTESSQLNIESCAFQGCALALQLAGASGISIIEKNKFHKNIQAIKILAGDKVIVKDNWITSGNMPHLDPSNYPDQYDNFRPCQIENRGFLHFETNLLVPELPEAGTIEPAWINNYGIVKVDGVRQGGEGNGGFTLINNFAGNFEASSNAPLPNSVIVKNSQCFGIYGNNDSTGLLQPAIVRYVSKIPNLTVIEANTGLRTCRIVDFSYYQYAGDTTAIKSMIAGSGPSTPSTVCVEVVNNVGAVQYEHGGYVPRELYPFIRNRNSLWVSPVSLPLDPIETTFDLGAQTVIYKFRYPGQFDSALSALLLDKVQYLINFTAAPQSGSAAYGGLYTAIMKAIGYWNGSAIKYRLYKEEKANQSANPSGVFPSPGPYNVAIYWDALPTGDDLPQSESNNVFCIKVTGVVEPGRISVAPLFDQ